MIGAWYSVRAEEEVLDEVGEIVVRPDDGHVDQAIDQEPSKGASIPDRTPRVRSFQRMVPGVQGRDGMVRRHVELHWHDAHIPVFDRPYIGILALVLALELARNQ
jgi:hypothetical protein